MTQQHPTHLVTREDGSQSLTIFLPGEFPVTVQGDHPHFDALREAAAEGADAAGIQSLADLSAAVAERFDRLSERVTVANGRVYFDGDEVDSSITRQIVRCLDEGSYDWQPLVLFMENIAANPVDHSREQLFDWLNARDFTLTQAGNIIAYKGVGQNDDGSYSPTYGGGYAIVNGERRETITQREGDTVELPRSEVVHDPSNACSFGLHVGTYEYAQQYARHGALLKVAVNPRDVVSVPTDASGQKVRVCRYFVMEKIDAPVAEAIEYDDHDECVHCGDSAECSDENGEPSCAWCAQRPTWTT